MTILAAILGFLIATERTVAEHRREPANFWGQRIGRSRWRRANLPVGGVLLLALAAAFSSPAFLAAAVAAAVPPILGRFIDPLPRP